MSSKDSTRLLVLFFILIACASCALLTGTLFQLKFATRADEGYYLRYANYISSHGLAGFKDLFSYYLADKAHWLFPNPLRIAYIGLCAVSVSIFGSSFFSIVNISLCSFFAFLLISFHYIRKYFDTPTALLVGILISFSPLNMAMARRALADAAVNMFAVASVWLFFDALKERRPLKYVLFVCVFAAAILIRENSMLLSLFFFIYLLTKRLNGKALARLGDMLLATVLPLGVVALVYFLAAGDISRIIATARIILRSPSTNEYAILFGSGPWSRTIIDFLLLSPWTTLLAIGFCVQYLWQRERRDQVTYFIILLGTMILLANFFTKNIRYVIVLDMPLRLLAVLALEKLTSSLSKERQFLLLLLAVVCISCFDYFNFYSLFVDQGIYDPITAWLLKGQNIIP